MAYEPMVLLFMAVAFYMAAGTFNSAGVFFLDAPSDQYLARIPGLLFVLTIKLRKSPFDLSYSHHAHQEIVKGITTEMMSGKTLAKVEIMHWCEKRAVPRLDRAVLPFGATRCPSCWRSW